MDNVISDKFYNALNALPPISDLSDAVSKSAIAEIAGKYFASISEIFRSLADKIASQEATITELTKNNELLSQSAAQLLAERNQAAQELLSAGNRVVDLSALSGKLAEARNYAESKVADLSAVSSKLTEARDYAQGFITKNLPQLFATIPQKTKLVGSIGLGAVVVATICNYYTNKDSIYTKALWKTLQIAGFLAVGAAAGSYLTVTEVAKIQAAFAKSL